MLGYWNKSVYITYFGAFVACFGFMLSLSINDIDYAFAGMIVAAVCDMFDGKVARTKKKRTEEEKHFGIQLDSLSDLVCFGVLPAIIGYKLGLDKSYLIPVVIFFPLAALIRLAYFNVLEILRKGNGPVKSYVGLPVTSAALVFPFLFD